MDKSVFIPPLSCVPHLCYGSYVAAPLGITAPLPRAFRIGVVTFFPVGISWVSQYPLLVPLTVQQ